MSETAAAQASSSESLEGKRESDTIIRRWCNDGCDAREIVTDRPVARREPPETVEVIMSATRLHLFAMPT